MTRVSFEYRDYEMAPEPQSVYRKIFGAPREYVVRKATYRGGTGSRLHMIQNLTREEAKHFLLHDRHGRQLRRDFHNVPFDTLADHLVEASGATATEKREVLPMSDHLIEVCKSLNAGDCEPLTEFQLAEQIQKLANARRQPGETSAAAFNRIYNAQDDDGLVLRTAVQTCKRHAGFPV